jgi:DNA-binding CsgD family transcriptional regulator
VPEREQPRADEKSESSDFRDLEHDDSEPPAVTDGSSGGGRVVSRCAPAENLTDPQRLEDFFLRIYRDEELSLYELGFLQGILAMVKHPALSLAAMRNYGKEGSFQPRWGLQHKADKRRGKRPNDYHAEAPQPLGRSECYAEQTNEVFRSTSEGWADAQLVQLFGYVPSHEADLAFREILRAEKREAERERLTSRDEDVLKRRNRGETYEEIMEACGLSRGAVQRSISRLRRRGAHK